MSLKIGELARQTGVKVETIRWYEKVGLIAAPARTEGNYRAYDTTALSRLSFIKRARDLGFSLDQIRALMTLAGDENRDCASVDAVAREHLADIDRKLADLASLRGHLATLIESCSGGVVGDCRILDALGPSDGAGLKST